MALDKKFAAKVLGNIVNLNPFRDVTLVAEKDQQKFPVHRIIVAASSEFLQNRLGPGHDSNGNNKNEFIVKDIDGPTLKMIIDYCYTGHIDLTADNICATIARASSLKIASLHEKCEEFWGASLAAENCVQLVSDAEKRGLTELWDKSMIFVRENFEDIPIAQLLELNAQSFRAVINHDHAYARETYIFEVLTKWIQHNKENRAKFVGVLLECIRLKHIPTEFFSETVEPFYRNYKVIEPVLDEYRRRSIQSGAVSLYRYKPINKTKTLYLVDCSTTSAQTLIGVRSLSSLAGEDEEEVVEEEVEEEEEEEEEDEEKLLEIKLIRTHSYGLVLFDNKLFIMGGESDSELMRSMWSYDLKTGSKTCMPDLAYGRANFISIAVGDFIYVFGGRQDVDMCGYAQDTSARFHIGSNAWEQLKPFPKPLKTQYASVKEFCGKIYVYICDRSSFYKHGNDDDYFLCYDPNSDEWTQKCRIYEDYSKKVILATAKNNMYALIRDATVHLYDVQQNKWKKIGAFRNGEKIKHTVEYCGKIYVTFRSKNRGGIFFGEVDPESCSVTPLVELSDSYDIDCILYTM